MLQNKYEANYFFFMYMFVNNADVASVPHKSAYKYKYKRQTFNPKTQQ